MADGDDPSTGLLASLRSKSFSVKALVTLGLIVALSLVHILNDMFDTSLLAPATEPSLLEDHQQKQTFKTEYKNRLDRAKELENDIFSALENLQEIRSRLDSNLPEIERVLVAASSALSPFSRTVKEWIFVPNSQLHSNPAPATTTETESEESFAIYSIEEQTRVFDFIVLDSDDQTLDDLEIRLNELYDVVDVFYLIEPNYSPEPPPQNFLANELRFRPFRNKIIHLILPKMSANDTEEYEVRLGSPSSTAIARAWTRDRGFALAIETSKPQEGDWILVSPELQQWVRPGFIQMVKNPDPTTEAGRRLLVGFPESDGDMIRLGCDEYRYSFEFRLNSAQQWKETRPADVGKSPVMIRYREVKSPVWENSSYPQRDRTQELALDHYRWAGQMLSEQQNMDTLPSHTSQCQQCHWCFSTLNQTKKAIQEMINLDSELGNRQPNILKNEWILSSYQQGLDLIEPVVNSSGESDASVTFEPENEDVPDFIFDNKERFMFLLSRKGRPNAGFMDVDSSAPTGEENVEEGE